ncbi:MAG TPA: hypothetical protein VFI73_08590 [Candidatus Nitrosopolaris sp.]|nr:hypothetical protein [Candidatus Nitrosopolaris sp.]
MSSSCSIRRILLELCAEEHKKYAMEVPKIPPPIIAILNPSSEQDQQIIIDVILLVSSYPLASGQQNPNHCVDHFS